jgi:hypothetical protein
MSEIFQSATYGVATSFSGEIWFMSDLKTCLGEGGEYESNSE